MKKNETPNVPQEGKTPCNSTTQLSEPSSTTWALALVVFMLVILFALIYQLLKITASYSTSYLDTTNELKAQSFAAFIDYSKWVFSGLITAFGAWIGAGAAYFFGKENLVESSRSTENALKIQHEAFRNTPKRDRIKDLALTIMNKGFVFNRETLTEEVGKALENHADYWWVPVVDKEKGTLENAIHARAFWEKKFEGKALSDILDETPAKDTPSKLHGSSFFIQAALDDKIADIASKMDKSGAVIGIVVDEKGKPSYCFTKQNLMCNS